MSADAFTAADYQHMNRALALARRGLTTVDPNPRVGCVIAQDDTIAGEGWHQRAGSPHAEVNALQAAGSSARGASAYVTLEPCCHAGRTPPCTQALIEAGIARVVAAIEDPNPAVAGNGLRRLAEAGIETARGLCAPAAARLNRGFISRFTRGRPFVTSKLAMSLDGRTAMADGTSRWITGAAARADVQRLRARQSAIVTGRGTVARDDPSLTVRAAGDGARQPLRVILDSGLSTLPSARTFTLPGDVVVITASDDAGRADALQRAGARIERVAAGPGGVDLASVMTLLARLECNDVLIEAGATLNGALAAAGLIDEFVIYMAPHVMGSQARALLDLPLGDMNARIALGFTDVRAVGRDLRITAVPAVHETGP